MTEIKIEMKNIGKVFETDEVETHALKDVNIVIRAGEYVSISGPSGCGKSTLLSLLGLLDMSSSGSYAIEGLDVSSLSLDEAAGIRNEKMGFVDNVALPLQYKKELPTDEFIAARVAACLNMVEMSHRADHKPNQLSGGQQQRIAIARALVADPAILLVDEPTGNLDSQSGDTVMAVLAELNKNGTTVCMVTHDARYADMAKIQLKLLDGQIVKDEPLKVAV
jgi:putative ABC transport system ATP-binding protein